MKFITFKNNTNLPLLLGTWSECGINGLSKFIEIKVAGMEEIKLYEKEFHDDSNANICSLTGEWIISSLFCVNEAEYDIWKKEGYNPIQNIGKFRSQSCFSGNNVWNNTDLFDFVGNKNLVVFSYSRK